MPNFDSRSIWQATCEPRRWPPVPTGTHVDVVVAGGGITGLTSALLLAEEGLDVAVLEARRIGRGTTGGSTGKVTSQHGLIYEELVRQHGRDAARTYGAMNQSAIGTVRRIVGQYDMAADLTTASAYVHTEREELVERLRREAHLAADLGLPATFTTETDLPFDVAGAVRFDDQAAIQAAAYLDGLAAAVDTLPNGAVHEDTRVLSLEASDASVRIVTDQGELTAEHVVVATLAPILDRGGEFARMEPSRTYGIAAPIEASRAPEGMYLSAEEPTRSVRRYETADACYLIVVGEAHRTGTERQTERHHGVLAAYARERFGATEVAHAWSAQDLVPADLLPFVGRTPFAGRIFVATGFNKWGLSGGTAAAHVITDTLQGRQHPAAPMLDTRRLNLRASARVLLKHNVVSGARFVADRLRPDATSVEDIPRGGAGIVRRGLEYLAVARDEDGRASVRSAVCSHLGCLVQWNAGERSWDCPCHGSRFGTDGEVLDGPAARPLAPRDRDDG